MQEGSGEDTAELYSLYLAFMDDSRREILPRLSQADSRTFFEKIHVPVSRDRFDQQLSEMSPHVRTRYIRRLRVGYACSTLLEPNFLMPSTGVRGRS